LLGSSIFLFSITTISSSNNADSIFGNKIFFVDKVEHRARE